MKSKSTFHRTASAGFTLVEVMISMTILVLVLGMAMSTYLFSLRMMYKDTQRLATNAALRSFMAQISKETLDASTFYLFDYYTKLNGAVDLTAIPVPAGPEVDPTGTEYDKWVTHGDCLVLVTKTSQYRNTDIKQIRIYYRVTTSQAGTGSPAVKGLNTEAALRYYETPNTAGTNLGWGEGSPDDDNPLTNDGNGHPISALTTSLNAINLNGNPNLAGSRQLALRTKGRKVPAPYTGYNALGIDYYPMFSTESPNATAANGYISINIEFINGTSSSSTNTNASNMLSSSSFNYTISPRR